MNIVENARELAFKYHEGQMYGKLPYTCHLEDVARILSIKHDIFKPETDVLLAVGFLHDVLEDTKCSGVEISEACGEDVYKAVWALTRNLGMSYEWYIDIVRANPIALEVKIADTLANLTASVMSGERGRILKYSKQLQLLVGE